MKRLFHIVLFAFSFTSFNAFCQSNIGAEQLIGTWKNEHGSTLTITQTENDDFTGTFKTAVADTKSCIGYPIPFKGSSNGNALAISMSLEDCGSPTTIAMVGSVGKENKTLDTIYLVQSNGVDTWKARVTGHDLYQKIN
ncbi:avidin/streptavidin family protein [Parashewanella tropica]|uniref:avidin/streptavidin family protein n=1 Tax=Parashewanella tropica TaxID=2547970 RepID=UPI001059B601|nr:avidin/streptavidin family protein [Parashewanella tropica]